MSRWHRENPEQYEQYGEPDWFRLADADELDQPCRTCGEYLTRRGQTCERCTRNMEEDRMNRELGQ